ncbi:MAG: hypothetical protein ACK4VV_03665 [Pseudomonas sp.]
MLISRLCSKAFRKAFCKPCRRHFARLDQQGRCTSLWTLQERPEQGRWIEVTELNPTWIGQSVPLEAQCPPANQPKRSLLTHLAW